MRRLFRLCALLVVVPVVALAACGGSSTSTKDAKTVTLLTYDSWAMPKKLITAFEKESGYRLKVVASGDAGQLTTKLALAAGNPEGDVAFGVDSTFAGRAQSAKVFTGDKITPVDHSAVCVDIDSSWFASHGVPEPTGLDDLVKPAYKGLFVTENAANSSPGLSFLLLTVAKYGDAWPTYWKQLIANGTEVADGWDTAFQTEFTQGGGTGTKPIVVSYDTDPAFAVGKDGTSPIKVVSDTCYESTEYAGVLRGTKDTKGATAVVSWLLSPTVQKALPDNLYVYPISDTTPLPASWTKFAGPVGKTSSLDPTTVEQHRDDWLKQWLAVAGQ